MDFLTRAIEALPAIATSPLAFVGYALTIAAWAFAVYRSSRLKLLLQKLPDIPAADRAKTIQLELGEVLPENISAEQWLRARNQRHFLAAFVIFVLTAAAIGVVALYEGHELAKVAEQARLRQEEIQRETQRRQDVIQTKRRSLEGRLQDLDEGIAAALREYARGATGLELGRADQKHIAIEIMQTAAADGTRLQAEKRKLQSQIDALPID